MTDNADSEQPNPEDFEAFMREFLEKGAQGMDVEKLAAAAGLPSDPTQMAALMAQLRAALGQMASSDGSVNWKLATDQARQLAASESEAPSVETQSELVKALSIASLWLNGATQISELTAEPKFLTRELWVQDAMPLFQALATPVAERMSAALSDSLRESAPEEIVGMIGNATSMMKSLGGALFAMQLGQSLGKLSSEVLTGGDIGLPIFSDQRAAFVTQNIKNYITALDVETDQVLIYLAVRELAHARLFKHSRWLREHVINQITQYASEIKIDTTQIEELTRDMESIDAAALQEAFQNGAFIAARSEDQTRALESIENTLALIEGWVDAVTDQATSLLPKSIAIGEAVRRRRATGGPAEKTFGTLIGLELRPRKLREAATLWREIGHRLGSEKRDALWQHPDMLPTADEIANPELLFARLDAGTDDGFDRALRDLLGE
jgi:putative hydrolase